MKLIPTGCLLSLLMIIWPGLANANPPTPPQNAETKVNQSVQPIRKADGEEDTLAKKPPTKAEGTVQGWFCDNGHGGFDIGCDESVKHSGTKSARIKSVDESSNAKGFGNLCQWFAADDYRWRHLRMTAWVKTNIRNGAVQLWVRVDGEGHGNSKRDCFDNMADRPIKGATDWKQYGLVVDVPATSTSINFGCMLFGSGEAWIDDVSIESVDKDVPLTGPFTTANAPKDRKASPVNLNFED